MTDEAQVLDDQWDMSLDPTITFEPPDQLLANPKNWRIHPETQQSILRANLRRIGWITGVIQNDVTGHLIDGHDRVVNAISTGQRTVPVIHVRLSQEKEDIALASLDTITSLAVTDQAKLEELLADIPTQAPDLEALLESMRSGMPPSLDDLAAAYGNTVDESTFWPVIRVSVPPETKEHYEALIGRMDGEDEAERFRDLLARAESELDGMTDVALPEPNGDE
jgi:hypothetical protein